MPITLDGTSGLTLPGTSTGIQVGSLTARTVQASTTGTVVEFLTIPSWVKRITMMLNGVSTNGTSIKQVQLGTSSGYQTTGYAGGSTGFGTSSLTTTNYTTGFAIRSGSASELINGSIILSLLDSTNGIWVAQGVMSDTTANGAWITSGAKTLSGTLDRVRLTTVNGTDAFDAGSVNILFE